MGQAAGIGGTDGGLVAVIGTRGSASSDSSMPTVGLSSSMFPEVNAGRGPRRAQGGYHGKMGEETNYGESLRSEKNESRLSRLRRSWAPYLEKSSSESSGKIESNTLLLR